MSQLKRTYLGTVLSNDVSPKIDSRIKAVILFFFYGLQGAGLCKNGVNASQLRHIFNPIRSGGGGALKAPPLRFFALAHLILELHYCALVTFPKK